MTSCVGCFEFDLIFRFFCYSGCLLFVFKAGAPFRFKFFLFLINFCFCLFVLFEDVDFIFCFIEFLIKFVKCFVCFYRNRLKQ